MPTSIAIGPAQLLIARVLRQRGDIGAAAQPSVDEDDGQPRRDPVGDDEQEVLVVLTRVLEPLERDDEADQRQQNRRRPRARCGWAA